MTLGKAGAVVGRGRELSGGADPVEKAELSAHSVPLVVPYEHLLKLLHVTISSPASTVVISSVFFLAGMLFCFFVPVFGDLSQAIYFYFSLQHFAIWNDLNLIPVPSALCSTFSTLLKIIYFVLGYRQILVVAHECRLSSCCISGPYFSFVPYV